MTHSIVLFAARLKVKSVVKGHTQHPSLQQRHAQCAIASAALHHQGSANMCVESIRVGSKQLSTFTKSPLGGC